MDATPDTSITSLSAALAHAGLSEEAGLVNSKWPGDIARQQEQIDILRGLLCGQ